MALDPRSFLIDDCGQPRQDQISKQTKRKDFFGSNGPFGKIGGLEVLNETKLGGKIGEGLRALVSTSNSIRSGTGQDTILGDSVANAENAVLSAVGIDANSIPIAQRLNPDVANRALGQAKSIFNNVKQGRFELNDIPQAFTDLQNLENLTRNIFNKANNERTKIYEQCGASPYATDLISYAPKSKYMFVVQFEYTEPYSDLTSLNHAFVVQTTTRPNISINYEDVNMYNYRTKVPTSVMYDMMSMSFYDDELNNAVKFFNTYLHAVSPISNLEFDQKMEDTDIYDESGMNFDTLNRSRTVLKNGSVLSHPYSASLGPLVGNETKNIMKRITLFHIYRGGNYMNVYRFFNPKISNMEFDELDQTTTGDGTRINIQFNYDAVNILTDYRIDPEAIRGGTPSYNLEQLSGGAKGATYPIRWYAGPKDPVAADPAAGPAANDKNASEGFFDRIQSAATGAVSSAQEAIENTVSSLF